MELLPGARFVSDILTVPEWHSLVNRYRPEIIVSGWHTPPIPVEAPNLRYICHVTGSVRRHVPRALIERGVVVGNWGDVVAEVVAEGVLTMILSSLRRIQHFGDLMHRQKGWQWSPGGTLSLFDRRVGIHGFGTVVRRLLPMLHVFRCPVQVFTVGVPEAWYAEHGVQRAESLEQLFGWADVVVEAEALTETSRGRIDEALLRRLRPGSVFVNIARGGLVDEAALARVAANGGFRVALDVFEHEPLPSTSPLRGLADAVLTPHLAGPTDDRNHLCGEFALVNLANYLSGKPIESRITLEIYDRST